MIVWKTQLELSHSGLKVVGAVRESAAANHNIFQMRVYEAFLCYHWLVFDEMRKIYGYNSDGFLETVMGGNDK